MQFRHMVALVTAAASGIGKATAMRLAQEGVRVAALGDTVRVRQTCIEITDIGGKAIPLVADVADAESMKRAIDELIHSYGRLDAVFANAAINGVQAPIDELSPEEWDRAVDTNLRGSFLTLHYAVPRLKKAGGGSVVISSSINGARTFNSGATAHACGRAALLALVKATALELATHHIRVNAICPGPIETEIQDNTSPRHPEQAKEPVAYPEGKIPSTDDQPGTAADVAELVLFLVSDRARHITGTPIWFDDGQLPLVG
jgi:NAD(P)-dependent dehydrogenase (short-subunit alcohol dehydrogenase family)